MIRGMIRTMAEHPIIFSPANLVPEIMPEKALADEAAVAETYPIQINNVLVFPDAFRDTGCAGRESGVARL